MQVDAADDAALSGRLTEPGSRVSEPDSYSPAGLGTGWQKAATIGAEREAQRPKPALAGRLSGLLAKCMSRESGRQSSRETLTWRQSLTEASKEEASASRPVRASGAARSSAAAFCRISTPPSSPSTRTESSFAMPDAMEQEDEPPRLVMRQNAPFDEAHALEDGASDEERPHDQALAAAEIAALEDTAAGSKARLARADKRTRALRAAATTTLLLADDGWAPLEGALLQEALLGRGEGSSWVVVALGKRASYLELDGVSHFVVQSDSSSGFDEMLRHAAWASLPPLRNVVSLWSAPETESLLAALRTSLPEPPPPLHLVTVSRTGAGREAAADTVDSLSMPNLSTKSVAFPWSLALSVEAAEILSALEGLEPRSASASARCARWALFPGALLVVVLAALLAALPYTPASRQQHLERGGARLAALLPTEAAPSLTDLTGLTEKEAAREGRAARRAAKEAKEAKEVAEKEAARASAAAKAAKELKEAASVAAARASAEAAPGEAIAGAVAHSDAEGSREAPAAQAQMAATAPQRESAAVVVPPEDAAEGVATNEAPQTEATGGRAPAEDAVAAPASAGSLASRLEAAAREAAENASRMARAAELEEARWAAKEAARWAAEEAAAHAASKAEAARREAQARAAAVTGTQPLAPIRKLARAATAAARRLTGRTA